jgi:phosphoserine phosphatase
VNEWLALRGTRLDALEQSWFYSDSASDLPLLEAVSDPVAVAPDERLRARALKAGWPVLERS